MEHTTLGRTGLPVSRLCMGTMTFGLQCDEPTSHAILDAAAEGGIDFLDAADRYPLGGGLDTAGRTEEIVGRWLKGKRDQFVLATKCAGPMGPEPWNQGTSRKHVLDAIDASLRRLDTDYVDLYQFHAYDPKTPLDESLDALDRVVQSGKARYVGVSNWMAHRVARALGRSEVKNLVRIDSVQPRYNLLFRSFERDLLPLCEEEGVAVIPYNPIAGGLLTGKHDRGSDPDPGHPLHARDGRHHVPDRGTGTTGPSTRSTPCGRWPAEAGMSMTTMAVSWVLANPAITSPIIGASKPEQLADSLAAVEKPMDADLKARLDEMTAEWRRDDALR